MRYSRIFFILIVFYITFIGGSAYYNLVPIVRVFHHAFITLVLGVWLINRLRTGRGLPATPLNMPILGAVVVWFLSALTSLDPRVAIENLWLPLTHTVMFFILVDLFQRGRQKLVMETAFILCSLVILITGLEVASWYFGLGIIPGTEVGWVTAGLIPAVLPRVALALNVSTWLAAFAAPLITITAAWAMTVRKTGERRVLWVLAACLIVVLILTFSRGGWLSLAGAVSVVILFRLTQSPRFRGRGVVSLAIAGFVIAMIGMVALLVVFAASGDRQSGDDVRIDLWRSAVDMTLDYPLLGVGPGLFGRAWRTYRDPYFARDHLPASHNAILNTSSETGMAGVVVSLWMAAALLIAWRRNWLAADLPARKLRLEAALGALVGLGIHSVVDVFTPTPVVLPILGLVAYCITGHRTVIDSIPAQSRLEKVMSLGFITIIAGYGAWFVLRVDPAHLSAYNAMRAPDVATALADAQKANELDPALNLYLLQIAYLRGIEATISEDSQKIEAAIEAYENALALEPTWDGGWINLAALHLQRSDVTSALEFLNRARQIKPLTNPATLHWAMLAEENEAADAEGIVDAYYQVNLNELGYYRLPLASFWWQTPLREMALQCFLSEDYPRDIRYRVLAEYKPETADLLVPDDPQTAVDWWVVGQHALEIENNPEKAFEAFDMAVKLSPRTGDYYASRAHAQASLDATVVERDLKLAQLYGVQYESIGDDAALLPSDDVNPGLTSVLYSGRVLAFSILPSMRVPYE